MTYKIWAPAVVLLILAACSSKPAKEEEPSKEAEPPTLSLTLWGARTELFMEYPPLVQHQGAACAVHLTNLADFRPLSEGHAILEMEKDGRVTRFESTPPKYPGIFRIDARPELSGRYRAYLRVRTPKLEDVHDLGEWVVHANNAAATRESQSLPEPPAVIRFLKEQQWGSEFATEMAAPRRILENLRVPATVRPRGDGQGIVVSPLKGRLLPEPKLPLPGQRVEAGQVVAMIVPFIDNPQDLVGLKLELSKAETDLALAQQQRERLEALLTERAIPANRVNESRAEETRVRARLEAARARLARFEQIRSGVTSDEEFQASAFKVRAPLGGVVTGLSVLNGEAVESGKEILHIMRIDHVWVVAEVPESEGGRLSGLRTAELEIPGNPTSIHIPSSRGKIDRIGNILDPESRRVPVFIDVGNQDGLLRIGQSLFVRLGVGTSVAVVAVPQSAVIDDGGRPIVLVQIAGEMFQRRPVRTGSTAQGYMQILDGVKSGERVVSKGAYSVRLAALSTQIPAHGHVH